jgi:hypothetical protein
MNMFLYVLGDDPYKNSHEEFEGNGEWTGSAHTVEEGLSMIFNNMSYPTEPVGRKFFLPGVSLTGVRDDEVIQVWSNEPEVVHRTKMLVRANGLHDGRNNNFGLQMELKATDVEKYLKSSQALIAAPASDSKELQPGEGISPMGENLLRFGDAKHELKDAIRREEMVLARRQWEMEASSNDIERRTKLMEEQLNVLNTYMHGTRHRTKMTTGRKGTGPYHVFQTRQFLSEEIALLANFDDFDFKKMEDLEKWLIKSGRIWKFLPFERCILATRLRKDNKDYGDPLANLYNNYQNMRNIVWIRDGENIIHVDTEFDFHNAVFPDRQQFDRALQVCLNHIWQSAFQWKKPKNFWGRELKPSEYDVMGEMKRKPFEEQEPYFTVRKTMQRFQSLQEWLDSEFYTDLLDKQIRESVQDYLREVNKRQMIFAVLLQGIVDNTSLLEIPKGTDLFNWENIDTYFKLLYDYSHALTWEGISKKVAPYLDGKTKVGDWVVALVDETIEPEDEQLRRSGSGVKRYKENRPILFQVTGHEEVTYQKFVGDGQYESTKAIRPTVNYHPIKSRRSRGEDYWAKIRTKSPMKLPLKFSNFLRVPMSPSLAEQILDDRDWKLKHKWAIPLMVNYKSIIAAVKKGENNTVLKWDDFDD